MFLLISILMLLISFVSGQYWISLCVMNIWFIITYKDSKHLLIYQMFLICFFLFHILPLNISLIKDDYYFFTQAIDSGRLLSNSPFQIILIITIFLVVLYFYKPKKTFLSNTAFPERIFNFDKALLVLFAFLAFYGKFLIFQQVFKMGYIEFHLGDSIVKRPPIFFIIEIIFLIMASICYTRYKKLSFLLLFIYAIFSLLSGMRLPFVILASSIIILFFNLNKVKYILTIKSVSLIFIFFIGFFGATQLLRTETSFDLFSWSEFIEFALQAQMSSLSSTNDLLGIVIYENLNEINTNPFYYLFDLYDQITYRFNNSFLSMNTRIQNGNIGYYIFSIYESERFSLGMSGGGTFIGEIFYFFGILGILIAAIFLKKVAFFFENCIKVKNHFSIFSILFLLPFFVRSFRDNYFNFIFYTFLTYTIYLFVIIVREIHYSRFK